MDDPGGVPQYLGVARRRVLLVLVGIVAAVYAALVAPDVMRGELEPVMLLYAVAMPALVAGGVVLLLRRPGHPIGELLVLSGLAGLVLPSIIEIVTVGAFERTGVQDWMWAAVWLSQTLQNAGVVLVSTLLVLLPDGRIRYLRERRFLTWIWSLVALPTLVVVSHRLITPPTYSFQPIAGLPNPVFIPALEAYGPAIGSLNTLAPLGFLGAIALLVARYRAGADRERKQIRWVLLAGWVVVLFTLVPIGFSELGVIARSGLDQPALVILGNLTLILLPASIVVAVLEPPWIDVDIVIRRSVVYGALSLAILLVYVAVAASVGVAAGAQLGLRVELAVVLTVLVALIFQPARRRLQALADRWVFGARPSGYQAVTDFGQTIEQGTEPAELLPRLVETIRTALRLRWVTVALDDGARVVAGTDTGDPVLRVALGAGGEEVGEIVCGPKAEGRLADDDVQLVRTLAGQLALAVRNARLAGRIVNAAESERRRIERNIHDGAQQELVALVARLGMARSAAVQGDLKPDVIDDMRLEAQQILSDLRELAQGIHPSVLSDGGIVEAVEDRCARLPMAVTLETADGLRSRRFGDNIEGAAYFFVSESLANVLKHAEASRATVSLTCTDGRLVVRVADDGQGFDANGATDGGLAGLRDRIRALGGTVTIASRPGEGTRITASLPVVGP